MTLDGYLAEEGLYPSARLIRGYSREELAEAVSDITDELAQQARERGEVFHVTEVPVR